MPYDDPKLKQFEGYYQSRCASQRERAENWAVAIGLQKVDGLVPSEHLISVAKRHIEGKITGAEATNLVDRYYETKAGRDLPEDIKEADRVAARINEVIEEDGFNFSPTYLVALHGLIFEGVFPHAGSVREVNLRKREWVLRGDSVTYGHAPAIVKTLEYDFDREREYSYSRKGKKGIVEHFARFIAGIWQIHPFREGNTRTTAVFAIKYLKSMRIMATNDLFAENSWFFRNALVRANYENPLAGISRDFEPLERFFRNLILGETNELKNRYLRALALGSVLFLLTWLTGGHTYNGTGIHIIEEALSGKAGDIHWYTFLMKILFTALSLAAGYKGGEIVPALYIGATFGSFLGGLMGLPSSFCAAIGMGALFCGVTNSPVASLFICLEMFGIGGLPYYMMAVALSYVSSGYYGLYSAQQILHSKYDSHLIDSDTH